MTASINTAAAGGALAGTPGRPARPGTPADYWQRVERIASEAPPLTPDQRARIRAAFHQPAAREAA